MTIHASIFPNRARLDDSKASLLISPVEGPVAGMRSLGLSNYLPMMPKLKLFIALVITLASARTLAAEPLDPIVFIPGILGSKLEDNRGVVWGDVLSSVRRFADLELPLEPERNKLRATAILDTISVFGPFQIGQYDGLLKTFEEFGYKQGENLFPFPYDWRQSNFDTAGQLRDFINKTKQLTDRKFSIVAHSMGGLVARIYVHKYGGAKRVNRIITLGTPHLGSAEALWTFLNGMGRFRNFVVGGEAQVKRVVFSFASLYELLPAYRGCCVLGAPTSSERHLIDIHDMQYWERFGWIPPDFQGFQQQRFIRDALVRASELQSLVALPLPQGIRLFKVAGDLIGTNSRVYLDKDTGAPLRWDRLGGDGTVPVVSATANDPTDSDSAIQVHSTIFNDDHVKIRLKRILIADRTLEKFAFRGTTGLVIAGPEDAFVPFQAIEIIKDDTYQQAGQRSAIHIRVQDEQGKTIRAVKVQAWLSLSPKEKLPLPVTEEPSGTHSAEFDVPAAVGIYRVLVHVPGAGLFEDYFAALQPEGR